MNIEALIRDAGRRYKCATYEDEINASRELLQYCVLSAFSESGLFEKTAFLGGTSLRLFRGLDRFSEDLDFSLMKPDKGFVLEPFLKRAKSALERLGLDVEFKDKSKPDVNVKKAFVRDTSVPRILEFAWATRKTDTPQKINVKVEIDANPPEGAVFETKTLPFPEKRTVTLFDMPSAFAGKCHALLTRKYIKGRDWYDFLFYVSQGVKPNYKLLTNALKQTGNYFLAEEEISSKSLSAMLNERIDALDMNVVKNDLEDFISDEQLLKVNKWSCKTFHNAVSVFSEYCENRQTEQEHSQGQFSPVEKRVHKAKMQEIEVYGR